MRQVLSFGHIAPPPLTEDSGTQGPPRDLRGAVPAWLVGGLERTLFTVGVALGGVPASLAPMIGWVGIKIAINWERRDSDNTHERDMIIRGSQVSVMASIISLFMALLGGLIVSALGG